MREDEKLRVAVFLLVMVAVYVLAGSILVRATLRRWLRRPTGPTVPRWVRVPVLLAAALGMVSMLYGRFVEPFWPEVTHVRVDSPKLRGASRPIRLVHLSDLHCDPAPRTEEELPALVAAQRPDLIVFTGDALNSPPGLPIFRRLMGRLSAIAPTYAVRGNWDVWYWSELDLFGGTGVRELSADGVALEVAGARLWLGGVAAEDDVMIGQTLTRAGDAGRFRVMLHHYPDPVEQSQQAGADLVLSGHTHGGQVALPLYGALVTMSMLGKRYESGLYRLKDTRLYVNRGIGMEGGSAPRVRFFARPEITVLELLPTP